VSEGRPFPSDVGRIWRDSTPAQRLGLGAFALICIGLLALTAALARRPHFAVLYANLQQEDAAEVVKRLREMKVAYRVTGSGTIEAPAARVDELRLDLASESLPAGGQAGFELFDRTRIGLSEFGEQLNYQRALQGELARTISHLDPVEEARVHISLPRDRLYASEEEKPTASVVVKLRGGGQLTSAQVRSVVHLVAGAVGGLAPEAVTVLDARGRLLSNADEAGPEGVGLAAASSQLQMRREFERQVEQAVQSMLDGVIGPGRAMVRASAALSLDRVETERETFEPTADGSGVLQSRRETKESYRGLAEPGAIGIPGISSNSAAPPTIARTTPRADQYEHTDLTADYRVSRQVERTLQPPGQLKRLSIAVFVDEEAKIGDTQEIKNAVAAAAGLDRQRGDEVVVSRVAFEAPTGGEKGSRALAARQFYGKVGRDFVAIVLAALFLWFVAGMLRRRGAPALPSRAPAAIGAAAPEPTPHAEFLKPEAGFDADRAAAVLRGWVASDHAAGGEPSPTQAGSGV